MIKEEIIKSIEAISLKLLNHTDELTYEAFKGMGQTLLDDVATINASMFSVDQLNVQLTLADMTHNKPNMPEEQPQPEEPQSEEKLGPLWKDLGISCRLRNVLIGIDSEYKRRYYRIFPMLSKLDFEEYRVGHFNNVERQRMFMVRNCGRKTVEEMEEFMNRYGFAFKSGK